MSNADPTAEMGVLSACYNYGEDAYFEIVDVVQPSSFTVPYNELFYVCIKHCFENMKLKTLDSGAINSAAMSLGLHQSISQPGCARHISQIIQYNVSISTARTLAGKIRKLEIGREMVKGIEKAKTDIEGITGDEKLSEIFKLLESPIFELSGLISNSDEPQLIGSIADSYVQDRIANKGLLPGLGTGFREYDEAIGGGLRYGSTNYICARIKNFKSGFALNVSKNVAFKGTPVLYFDTELQNSEQMPRLLGSISGVNLKEIERGTFSDSEDKMNKVKNAVDKVSQNFPFYHINIADLPFEVQISTMRRWLHKVVGVSPSGVANKCLIIYDYVKLLDPGQMSSMSEHQAIGFIATGLQNFALKYKVPIMCFAQLNRDGIDKESSAAIAQSDRIAWFCSNASILKQKSDEEIAADPVGNYKLVPIICRHGAGLKFGEYINLEVKGSSFQISELGLNTDSTMGGKPPEVVQL